MTDDQPAIKISRNLLASAIFFPRVVEGRARARRSREVLHGMSTSRWTDAQAHKYRLEQKNRPESRDAPKLVMMDEKPVATTTFAISVHKNFFIKKA